MLKKIARVALCAVLAVSMLPTQSFGQAAVMQNSPSMSIQLTDWQIAPTQEVSIDLAPVSAAAGADGSVDIHDPASWTPAAVPGTVLGALLDAKKYDHVFTPDNDGKKDVYFSDNITKIPYTDFLEAKKWWYATEFAMPSSEAGKKVTLTFKGISYVGEIYINGNQLQNKNITIKDEAELGTVNPNLEQWSNAYGDNVFDEYNKYFKGTFRTYELDVTEYVKFGESEKNSLKVLVTPPYYKGRGDADTPRAGDFTTFWVDWDPQPNDSNMGLTGPVYVSTSGDVRLSNPFVASKVATDLSYADLTLYVDVNNMTGAPKTGDLTATIKDPDGNAVAVLTKHGVAVAPGAYCQEVAFKPAEFGELHMVGAQLWWPYMSGGQPLYTVDYDFALDGGVSDSLKHRFGIREVSVSLNVPQSRSTTLMEQFYCNHRPIVMKGGGYQPTDLFLRHSQRSNQAVVDYIKYMGMNMVRDEGKFFDNDLLDLFDENGIMYLQGWCCCDRNQSSSGWTKAERFIVYEATAAQVRNLRSHASGFLWYNGSDAVPTAPVNTKLQEIEGKLRWYDHGGVAGSAATAAAGQHMSVTYDTQTPSFFFSFNTNNGFVSEGGGGTGIPVKEGLRKIIPDANLWPYNVGPNYNIWNFHACRQGFANIDTMAMFMDGTYGASNNIDEFIMRAQIYQYDTQRAQYEALNKDRFNASSGYVNWMLNGAWPIIYWNQFDFYMNPHGSTFGTRKGNEPVHIMYDGFNHDIYVINNTLEDQGLMTASFSLYDINGNRVSDTKQQRLWVGPDGAAPIVPNTGNNFTYANVGRLYNDADGTYSNLTYTNNGAVKERAYGVNKLWGYDDIQSALTRPSSDVYFLRLELRGSAGNVVSYNSYAIARRNDVAQGGSGNYARKNAFQTADLTQLNGLPALSGSQLSVTQTDSSEAGGKIVQTLEVKNSSESIAYAVELKAYKSEGELVAPVIYDDNLFTLYPGETRVITVSHNASDLAGDATIKYTCYNNVIANKPARSANIYSQSFVAGATTNLAGGKPVTGSGGGTAANATDRAGNGLNGANNGRTTYASDITTVYTPTGATPNFYVDLQEVQKFDRIMVRWNKALTGGGNNNAIGGRPDHVRVDISDDASSWTTIIEDHDNTAGASTMTNIILPQQYSARYVRFYPSGLKTVSPAFGAPVASTNRSPFELQIAQRAAPTAFDVSAIEVYAFNASAFLDIVGDGKVTVGATTYTSKTAAASRTIAPNADDSLTMKFTSDSGKPFLVFRDGADITSSLSADGTATLTGINSETEIKAVFNPTLKADKTLLVPNDTVRASAVVPNMTGADMKATVIAAIYDKNGRLHKMSTKESQTIPNNGCGIVDLDFQLPDDISGDNYSVQLFLWDGSYVPLVKPVIVSAPAIPVLFENGKWATELGEITVQTPGGSSEWAYEDGMIRLYNGVPVSRNIAFRFVFENLVDMRGFGAVVMELEKAPTGLFSGILRFRIDQDAGWGSDAHTNIIRMASGTSSNGGTGTSAGNWDLERLRGVGGLPAFGQSVRIKKIYLEGNGAFAPTAINARNIMDVVPPRTGNTPVKTITTSSQYTGTVEWSPNHATFQADTVYTANITLTPRPGWTLDGVAANWFRVFNPTGTGTGATGTGSGTTHAAGSGVITKTFPATVPVVAYPEPTQFIALSFDDVYLSDTGALLDVIDKLGIKVTFFQSGINLEKARTNAYYKSVVARMVASGHEVASHAWQHERYDNNADVDVTRADFKRNQELIYEFTGKYPRWIRIPYASHSANSLRVAGEFGLTNLRGLATDDWDLNNSVSFLVNRILTQTGNNRLTDGQIYVQHNQIGQTNTMQALPEIVHELRSRGIGFMTLSDLRAHRNFNALPGVNYPNFFQ